MLEIKSSRAINKGALLSTLDVYVPAWNLVLKDIKVFEKGERRWISLPSKEIVGKEGERVFLELVAFDSKDARDKFSHEVLAMYNTQVGVAPTLPTPAIMPAKPASGSIPF